MMDISIADARRVKELVGVGGEGMPFRCENALMIEVSSCDFLLATCYSGRLANRDSFVLAVFIFLTAMR